MAKTKLSLMIVGSVLLLILGALISYFILLGTGQVGSTKQKIEITLVDKEKEYDGSPLYASDYEITSGKLLNGDRLEIEYINSIIDYGTGESDCNIKIYDKNNYDKTSEYKIKIVKGNLEVLKRPISLGLKVKDHNYDPDNIITIDYSENLTNDLTYYVTSETNICRGHTLVPSFVAQDIKEKNNKLESEISLTCEIYDMYGVDVTKNYNIYYEDNFKINVNKPVLEFKTKSLTKSYDGIPFTIDDYKSVTELSKGTLPNNYTIDYTYSTSSITNVEDSQTLELQNVTIRDSKYNDVTNNYIISCSNVGYVSITPYEIGIEASSQIFEYDGDTKTYHDFHIVEDDKLKEIMDGTKVTGFKIGNVEYSIDVNTDSSPSIVNVGSIVNILKFRVYQDSNEDISQNFRFVYERNTPILTVKAKNLTVYCGTERVNYNGNVIEINEDITDEDDRIKNIDGLPNGTTFKATLVGNCDNVGTYQILLTDFSIMKNGENITDNFNIITNHLTLIVEKQKIYVTSIIDYEGTYTGYAQKSSNISIDKEMLMIQNEDKEDFEFGDDITFKARFTSTITDCNENGIANEFELLIYRINEDETEESITDMYNIIYQGFGIMSLEKAELKIVTKTLVIPYENNDDFKTYVENNIKFNFDVDINNLNINANLGTNTISIKEDTDEYNNLEISDNSFTLKAQIYLYASSVEYGNDIKIKSIKNQYVSYNPTVSSTSSLNAGIYNIGDYLSIENNYEYVYTTFEIKKIDITVIWETISTSDNSITITKNNCTIVGANLTNYSGGGTKNGLSQYENSLNISTTIPYCFTITFNGSENYNITYVSGAIIYIPE